ncbi:MAG: type III pantothenate kinase [Dehalococcoidia bacterium]
MLVTGLLRTSDIDTGLIRAPSSPRRFLRSSRPFEAVCRRYFGVMPLVVGTGVKTGVRVRYDSPREVGPDPDPACRRRSAPLQAAAPIIVDLGTALVFDAVSREVSYLGRDRPGHRHRIAGAVLARRDAARQPAAAHHRGSIGRNTVHSMQSEIFFGYAEMVAGMVRRFKADIGEDATVIATGGYAEGIAPRSPA